MGITETDGSIGIPGKRKTVINPDETLTLMIKCTIEYSMRSLAKLRVINLTKQHFLGLSSVSPSFDEVDA